MEGVTDIFISVLGSHALQSSNSKPGTLLTRRRAGPLQSRKKSPSTTWPENSRTEFIRLLSSS